MSSRFQWTSDTLDDGLRRALSMFETHIRQTAEMGIISIVDRHAPEVESFMKQKARWQDQTGAARSGLRAQSFHEPSRHTIVAYHTVLYGPYLEVNYNGRYAIINLTIEEMGRDVMEKLRNMLGHLNVGFPGAAASAGVA